MNTHITHGDYSQVMIKKVVCLRCRALIKKYNLQLLLTQDECLCPVCQPVESPTKDTSHGTV